MAIYFTSILHITCSMFRVKHLLITILIGMCCALFMETPASAGDGEFFREYSAEWNETVSNQKGRLRVNDPDVSLDERWGIRPEALTNGLMLINAPEDLFQLERAELYLELWGGHPHTANKRFMLNGKKRYNIPEEGTAEGHCAYSYPVIPLEPGHMVRGINAFQFACDRGESFWGHFIIDHASVRCYLKADHPDLVESGLDGFSARVSTPDDGTLNDTTRLSLTFPERFAGRIVSVDYYGKYRGFDDTGSGYESGWHGYMQKGKPVNHIGTGESAPFDITWDTVMIPDQDQAIEIQAVVRFDNNFMYKTQPSAALMFAHSHKSVAMYSCDEMPVPFWSRASREKKAVIKLPEDLRNIDSAKLMVKVWDGGEGTIKDHFTINGHPYKIVTGRHIHDVVFTDVFIDPSHLKPGNNELRLLSDTEHHGIEILLPGPCIVIRQR